MGTPAAGSVVLGPFPFSDLSQSKQRPAVVLAEAGGAIGFSVRLPVSLTVIIEPSSWWTPTSSGAAFDSPATHDQPNSLQPMKGFLSLRQACSAPLLLIKRIVDGVVAVIRRNA